MSETAYLAMLLDGPLQSWGFSSRFQRRTTELYPSKSGVIGLICAAMGLAKGSDEESRVLPELAGLSMTTITIPRAPREGNDRPLPIRRMEDFHTALDTRRASGSMNRDAVITRRQYLNDARFGVILAGDRSLLEKIAASLKDPMWGIWLGRKNCIPAEPILRGLLDTQGEAERALVGDVPAIRLTRMEEVEDFNTGTDTYNDQPVSFGRSGSSTEGRAFTARRIKLIVGKAPEE